MATPKRRNPASRPQSSTPKKQQRDQGAATPGSFAEPSSLLTTYHVPTLIGVGLLLLVGLITGVTYLFTSAGEGEAQKYELLSDRILLPHADLEAEVPVPTVPLKDVEMPAARRFEDTSEYKGRTLKRAHGVLATNFKHPDFEPKTLVQPLARSYPDYRHKSCKHGEFYRKDVKKKLPSASVVIIFCDEPFETLFRTLHSILNTSDPSLLKEIILVDDGSNEKYISKKDGLLEKYIEYLPKVKLVRNGKKTGIMRARTEGILQTTSDIFIVLDSHIEAEPGWLEPLLHRVNESPWSFVTPLIDSIASKDDYKPVEGGIGCHLGIIWRLQDHAFYPMKGVSKNERYDYYNKPTAPSASPVMAGGLFAARKEAFLKTGGYDLGMEGWGAENVEIGFRLWQCGAKIECMPCSRLGHIFDRGQTYKGADIQSDKGQEEYNKNRLRTAAAWMDEYGAMVYQMLGRPGWEGMGNMDRMFKLRNNLQCKSHEWFMKEIYPESHIVDMSTDVPYMGPLVNEHLGVCLQAKEGMHPRRMFREEDIITMSWPQKNPAYCPWVIYFKRMKAITEGFDDESALTLKDDGKSVTFDWNRDGRNRNARWDMKVIEIAQGIQHGVRVQIKSEDNGLCLRASPYNSPTFSACDASDPLQKWLTFEREWMLQPTNFYQNWLEHVLSTQEEHVLEEMSEPFDGGPGGGVVFH